MEEWDFLGLLACYSDKGRSGVNPIMLHSVVTYAYVHILRAVDRIVDLCQRGLAFIWRGNFNSYFAGRLDIIDVPYAKYNAFFAGE